MIDTIRLKEKGQRQQVEGKEKEEWILILKKIIGQDPPARQDFAQYQIQPA
jgi:hypothetical protein